MNGFMKGKCVNDLLSRAITSISNDVMLKSLVRCINFQLDKPPKHLTLPKICSGL